MIKNPFQSKHEGTILINNSKIRFIVLQDNSCLIAADSVYKLFGKTKRGRKKELNTTKIPFLHTSFLKKHLDEQSKKLLFPITYKSLKNTLNEGYTIELIYKITHFYTNTEVEIPKNQTQLYNQCIVLQNEVLKKNIRLLVYKNLNCSFYEEGKLINEGTSNYTNKILHDWIPAIPIRFYLELFRLNDWKFNKEEIKKRPSIIAKWLDALVFQAIEKKLKTSSKAPIDKTLRGSFFVKPLFELNTNSKLLDIQLIRIITLMNISSSIKEVWTLFEKSSQLKQNKIEPPFLFNEEGYTIEPIDDSFLSDFNLKLKTALEFNPNRKSRT